MIGWLVLVASCALAWWSGRQTYRLLCAGRTATEALRRIASTDCVAKEVAREALVEIDRRMGS